VAQDIVLVLRVDDKGTQVIKQFSAGTKDSFTKFTSDSQKAGKSLDATTKKLKDSSKGFDGLKSKAEAAGGGIP